MTESTKKASDEQSPKEVRERTGAVLDFLGKEARIRELAWRYKLTRDQAKALESVDPHHLETEAKIYRSQNMAASFEGKDPGEIRRLLK